MSDAQPPKSDPSGASNTEKPTDQWVTGDEPMTGAQASYLKTLCEETGHDFDPDMTKAAASDLIDQLQQQSDRLS